MSKIAFRGNETIVHLFISFNNSCKLRPLLGPAKRGRRRPIHSLNKRIAVAGSYETLLHLLHSEHNSVARW